MASGGPVNTTNVIPGTSTGYEVLSLPCDDENYNLDLQSYFTSKFSSIVSASTTTPPNDAKNLTCSDIFTDNLTLTWNKSNSSGALVSQNLYQDGILIATFDSTINTTLVNDLVLATDYTFKITSLNAN